MEITDASGTPGRCSWAAALGQCRELLWRGRAPFSASTSWAATERCWVSNSFHYFWAASVAWMALLFVLLHSGCLWNCNGAGRVMLLFWKSALEDEHGLLTDTSVGHLARCGANWLKENSAKNGTFSWCMHVFLWDFGLQKRKERSKSKAEKFQVKLDLYLMAREQLVFAWFSDLVR